SIGLALRLVGSDDELSSVQARFEQHRAAVQREKDEVATTVTDLALGAIANLIDPSLPRGSLDRGHVHEADLLAQPSDTQVALVLACYWLYKLMVLCVHGDHRAAIPFLDEVAERMAVLGQSLRTHGALFLCVHAAALLDGAQGAEAARYRALFDEQERLL